MFAFADVVCVRFSLFVVCCLWFIVGYRGLLAACCLLFVIDDCQKHGQALHGKTKTDVAVCCPSLECMPLERLQAWQKKREG